MKINGEPIQKPNSNEKPEQITIDPNNLKDVEISNFITTDSRVKHVTINGQKLNVVYKSLRAANTLPTVYIVEDKLVIPVDVLKYIGLEEDTYKIEVTLEDGSTVIMDVISILIAGSTLIMNGITSMKVVMLLNLNGYLAIMSGIT